MSIVEVKDEVLATVEARFGFVPNVIREMSKSPAAARVYVEGQEAMAGASLTATEQQAVQLAVSVHNACGYCQAAHRLGGRMAGISAEDLLAIEKGTLPRDPRLKPLVHATCLLLERRGFLGKTDIATIEGAGVDRPRLYEIIALIGLKAISNYVNHIAHTEIDEAFRG